MNLFNRFFTRVKNAAVELWIWLFGWIPTPAGVFIRWIAWRFLFRECGFARFYCSLTISDCKNISIGHGVRIGKGCFLSAAQGRLIIGEDVAISPNVNIGADNGEIIIEKFCAIGPGTVLRAANHNFADNSIPITRQGHKSGKIRIEEDVWIGANCVITPNVIIGKGAIVGAGSVVTRDVAPCKIVGGVPAREIGKRSEQ